MPKLLYQGHGSFRIVSDKNIVIYVDPYAGEGYDLPADLILVTHQHHDHNQISKPQKKDTCKIIDNVLAKTCGSFEEFGIQIKAVEAANKNHDPNKCVGYILVVDNIKIYASGDTSKTKQMETLNKENIDYALLCCDGVYNMGLAEAAECANLIAAKHTIPIHIKAGQLFDETRAKEFAAKNKLILCPNQEIQL